jgi:hypothetical protein
MQSGATLSDGFVPKGVAIDSGGNSYVVGNLFGTANFGGIQLTTYGGSDIALIKYSPTGAVLWAKHFGDISAQNATGVAVDTAGNVYIIGWYTGSVDFDSGFVTANNYDVVVAKYSPTGAPMWSKVLGGSSTDEGVGIAVDGTGNVYVTGVFAATVDFGGGPLTSAGGFDVFLAKYTTNGAYAWATRMGGTSVDNAMGIAVDGSGNPIVTGYFSGTANFGGGNLVSTGANDVFVVKYSAAGAHQWSKRFGDANDQRAYAVAAESAGNIAVTGYYYGTIDFGGGAVPASTNGACSFVAKLNANGGQVWSKGVCPASGLGSGGTGVAFDSSGNLIVAGGTVDPLDLGGGPLTAPTGTYDPFVVKYASDGTYQWARRFTNDWDDHANGIATDSSGNVYEVGDTTAGLDLGAGLLVNHGGGAGWIVKLHG